MKDKLKELFYSEDYKLFWELCKSQKIENITFDFNRFITKPDSFKEIMLDKLGLEFHWQEDPSHIKSTKLHPKNPICLKWKDFDVDLFKIIDDEKTYLNYDQLNKFLKVLQSEETMKYLSNYDDEGCLAYISHKALSSLIIKMFEYNDK